MQYSADKIRQELIKMKEEDYKVFSSKLIPNISADLVLGIRLPKLRTFADKIVKSGECEQFLTDYHPEFLEEKLLFAFVLGKIKLPYEQKKQFVAKYIEFIDSWSACDSAVAAFKFIGSNKADFFAFLQCYFNSEKEYYRRFAVYCYIGYYLDDGYIDAILQQIENNPSEYYYVNMAYAFLLATAYINYPDNVDRTLLSPLVTKEVVNMTVSKICQSFRVSARQKAHAREIKEQKLR